MEDRRRREQASPAKRPDAINGEALHDAARRPPDALTPAMLKLPKEDLFQDTTMTFGEHLDELRRCLMRAVLGLLVGFGIGLWYGKDIVRVLQAPLQSALETYYAEEAVKELQGMLRERNMTESEIAWTVDHLQEIIVQDEMLFDFVFVSPENLTNLTPGGEKISEQELLRHARPQQKYETVAALAVELQGIYADALDGEELKLPPADQKFETADAMLVELKRLNPTLPKDVQVPLVALRKAQLTPMLFWHPMSKDQRLRLKSFGTQESFMIYIKAAFVLGAVLGSPWIFYQLWLFVASGLYPHEKRYVYWYGPMSLGLFLFGALFAFFAVFEPVLYFLLTYNRDMGIDPDPRITEWLNFVIILPLAFGVSFQLPMVMLFLERIGIFTMQQYLAKWRIAVLVIFVVSAVLTPADPYTIFFMALPLTVLYFLAIGLCKYFPRNKSPFEEAAA
jgi:sec-independent protein translocase protein TatC